MDVNRGLSEPPICRTLPRSPQADWVAALGLCVVVFLSHAGSLNDGLFFDDHWHRATLRSYGWGFNDLVESATFNLPGRLVHLWWQEVPLQWRYARPVAMLIMKIELLLTGGSPLGIHVCALLWHALATILVYKLTAWVTRARLWAFLAACTFAIQPHSVFGVGWIAARNALVSGVFFLSAIYIYAGVPIAPLHGRGVHSKLLLGIAIALWGLALFSRETAIVFPLLAPALDLLRGGVRLASRRLGFYVLLLVLAGMYLYWRLWIFPVAGPPKIYFTAPTGAAYVPWALIKMLHMLFALIFQTPMFLGVTDYAGGHSAHWTLYAVMAILLIGMMVWYVYASRGLRTRWLWPLWTVAAFVPVIPVFVMPHFAYLPAAGFTVMLGVMLSRLRPGWRGAVTVLVLGATLWSFTVYRWLWRGIVRSEQLIAADIATHTAPPPPGGKLFFINLPVAGIYTPVTMRALWQQPDLEGYVLTFSPQPLIMPVESTVEVINDYELVVATSPPGYFTGLSGRMLLDGMRTGAPLETGQVIPGELFDATILAGSREGISRIKFTFHKPLSSDDFYFYLSSPGRPARRLQFDSPPVEELDEHWRGLFERVRKASGPDRSAACTALYEVVRPLLSETGSTLQAELQSVDRCTDETLERLEEWCRRYDAPSLQSAAAAFRAAHAEFFREQSIYFRIEEVAKRIVRSDLYLTGDGRNNDHPRPQSP